MLYLSRLILDARNRTVQRHLADCHQLHKQVCRAFPTIPDDPHHPAPVAARDHFGLLYRIEPFIHHPHLLRLLVQSNTAPDWAQAQLPSSYLAPAPDARGNPAVRRIDPEYDHIAPGMHFQFRLRANPTKRISHNDPAHDARWHGKRVELRREADQLAWLTRKGEHGGFRLIAVATHPGLPDTRATNRPTVRGRSKDTRNQSIPLTFGDVLFEGRLTVTDRAVFLATLHNGIGSGKAFGFGLLSIASVS